MAVLGRRLLLNFTWQSSFICDLISLGKKTGEKSPKYTGFFLAEQVYQFRLSSSKLFYLAKTVEKLGHTLFFHLVCFSRCLPKKRSTKHGHIHTD